MHRDEVVGAQRLQPDVDQQAIDLHRLAAKLTEIAAELRGGNGPGDGLTSGKGYQNRPITPHQSRFGMTGVSGAGAPSAGTSDAGIAGSRLASLRGNGIMPDAQHREFVSSRHRRVVNAEYARVAYHIRRRRADIFGNAELFGEPAWDILLDLYIAYVEDKPVSVSSACIGSAAPPTTGLRWLGILSESGFVLREHDPFDQRRVLVRLTESGLTAMDDYFASAGRSA